MVLREFVNPASPGASRAMDAIARFGMRFASYRNQSEVIESFCEALTAVGYLRAAVGHRVEGDPLRILPLVESPSRESAGAITLPGEIMGTFPALDGRNPYVTETTIAWPGGSGSGAAETAIVVVLTRHGEGQSVLVVCSSEPDAFEGQERAAVECAAVHLSLALEFVEQRAMAQSGEDKYRQLLENIDEIIYTATLDGRITYVNPAIERVLGVPAAAFLERGFEQFVPTEDRAAIWDGFTRQRQGEGPTVELRVKDARGQLRVLRASLFPLQTGAGDLVGVASDVTEQVVAGEHLLKAFEGTIRVLGGVTVARDPYTARHQERVAHLAGAVAEEMSLGRDGVRAIRYAGLVHDIGKVSVPAEILNKPTTLTEPERALLEAHPAVGHRILSEIEFPWPIAEIVVQHHERLNGSGYPYHLRGSEIVLGARVLAVADVVEAMESHRPYRPARGPTAARNEIISRAGDLYDSDVVAACVRVLWRDGSPLEAWSASA